MRIIKLIPTAGRVIEKKKERKKENKNKVVNYICPADICICIHFSFIAGGPVEG